MTMSPRVKKFSFFGALSAALAFVLNVVFFCHKSHNKAQGSKHRQVIQASTHTGIGSGKTTLAGALN